MLQSSSSLQESRWERLLGQATRQLKGGVRSFTTTEEQLHFLLRAAYVPTWATEDSQVPPSAQRPLSPPPPSSPPSNSPPTSSPPPSTKRPATDYINGQILDAKLIKRARIVKLEKLDKLSPISSLD
ncbi:hypothetical protein K469DRAFT_684482 [Zopfia rhizophila CBS 207.26]|uniref:Uncharacterized protein n=1 Tax=Zopfia rhizophila CBS 207.26 TaxID=1314779 RepID=A0A6A6D6U0_9PEZI|nr:hypothetical protein K469DRAFT_684482 [Zopfia rhizophila CBS 207.26]